MPGGREKHKQQGQGEVVERYAEEVEALALDLLRGDCVVFAGAGVSAEALPKWSELVEMLGRALPELGSAGSTPGDFLDIAQWYVEEHGRERLLREIVRIYGGPEVRPTRLAEALAQLPAGVFFTTNYDRTLEMALRQAFKVPDVVVDDRHIALVDERNRSTVVKMHGSVGRLESIVLTREDYTTYASTHRATITYLQSLLATRTILFVGFSFSDPNFRVIYDAIQRPLGRYRRRPYALVIEPDTPLMVRHWERLGVRMLTFPREGGEEAVLEFVQTLSGRVAELRSQGKLSLVLERLASPDVPPSLPQANEVARHLDEALVLVRQMVNSDDWQDTPADSWAEGEDNVVALFRLAEGFEGLGLSLSAADWARLGDDLFRRGHLEESVHAYLNAIRLPAEERDEVTTASNEVERRLLGNLARAYIGLRHYARAEDLLRQLVFCDDGGEQQLDVKWLQKRPGDLVELGHLVNTAAELAIADGDRKRAAATLDKALPWLQEALAGDIASGDKQDDQGAAEGTRAAVLSVLGRNYRLQYDLASRAHERAPTRDRYAEAVGVLEEAVTLDPRREEAWCDLLLLHRRNSRPQEAKRVVARLERLAADERGREVLARVRELLPEAWSDPGAESEENRREAE